jgi:SNF2 family DNA or RNA helicase
VTSSARHGEIHLEKKGRRIEIRSSGPLPGLQSAVPGAYYSTKEYWTVPLSLETCKLLRLKYGDALVVGSELRRWARTVRGNRNYMAELAASEDAALEVLPRVAPRLAKAMSRRTYQRVGARFVADSDAALVADDPGLGKTLIALGGLLEAEIPGPYLVVAPKTAADSVWRREILRWLPHDHKPIILPEDRDGRERTIRLNRFGNKTWLIVHPEIVMVQALWVCHECGSQTAEGNRQKRDLDCGHMREKKTEKLIVPSYKWLFDIDWGAIINDESHETLIKRKGAMTQRRRGMEMLKLRPDGMRIAMSGTPFNSRPEYLWGTLNWLDPLGYPAYHRWAELFWTKGGYTGHEIGEFRQDREPLLWDSLKPIALRRTKAEVASDLPPKVYVGAPLDDNESSPIGVWLPMTGKQADAYQAMAKLSIAELDSGRLEATSALEELTRLKQLACSYGEVYHRVVGDQVKYRYRPAMPSNKYAWIVNALEEWGFPKDPITKVVIVSMYTGILNAFREGLETHFRRKADNPLTTAITGLTPGRDRRRIIDQFNRRDKHTPQVMLLNVKAGGTAITLDTADRMIFVSETRIPDQQLQAEDRIHRVSNPRHCMYYYLRSLGTVDEGTALINQELDQATRRLLDGRRGVEYLRTVLKLSDA